MGGWGGGLFVTLSGMYSVTSHVCVTLAKNTYVARLLQLLQQFCRHIAVGRPCQLVRCVPHTPSLRVPLAWRRRLSDIFSQTNVTNF